MAEYLAYINAIEINPTDEESYAVHNNLTPFIGDLSDENKQAVKNTTLLASKAADKAAEKGSSALNWYKKYTEVLTMVGWVDAQSLDFTPFSSSQEEYTIETAILEFLSTTAPNDVAVTKKTLEAIGKPSGEPAWQIFAKAATKDSKTGSFQIASCREDKGDVVMSMSAYHFKSSDEESRFLWSNYKSSNIKFYHAYQTTILNKDVYDQVKDAIIKKLGPLVESDVAKIPT